MQEKTYDREKIYDREKKDVVIEVPPATVDIAPEPKYKPGQSVKINPGCRIRIPKG